MCTPHPPPPNPQAAMVPSMQAASSIVLGNGAIPHGAAGLGRLALRIGGSSAQQNASTGTAGATSSATPTPVAPASPPAAGNTPAIAAQEPGVGTSPGSLAGLRFGANYGQPYA